MAGKGLRPRKHVRERLRGPRPNASSTRLGRRGGELSSIRDGVVVATFALMALIALGVWLIGSLVLRVVGVLIVIAGLVGALQGQTAGLLVAAIGAVAWLAGHSLYAYRHHVYRSPLARRLFLSRPLQALDPTRGWAIPADAPDEPRDGRGTSP
jgi:hypothetical protein